MYLIAGCNVLNRCNSSRPSSCRNASFWMPKERIQTWIRPGLSLVPKPSTGTAAFHERFLNSNIEQSNCPSWRFRHQRQSRSYSNLDPFFGHSTRSISTATWTDELCYRLMDIRNQSEVKHDLDSRLTPVKYDDLHRGESFTRQQTDFIIGS